MIKTAIKIGLSLFLTMFFLLPQCVLAQSNYHAERIEQSYAAIPELKPFQTLEFWVKFKNTGQTPWQGSGPNAVVLRTISGMKSKFANLNWYSNSIPNRVNPFLTIYPNDQALFRFTLKAPNRQGLQWEKFQLFAGPTSIQGGEIEIAIKVVRVEKKIIPPPTPTPVPQPTPTPAPISKTWWQNIPSQININDNLRWKNLPQGPEIEVGLLYVEQKQKKDYLPFKISTLKNTLYNVYDKNNKLLVRNTAGEIIEIDYDYKIGRYFLNDSHGKRLLMSDSYFKIKGNSKTIFKINSWQNGPFWGQNTNDNEFKGFLKIHYNPNTQRIWLINQIPMEQYVKGLAEVGDSAPMEFLKAQIIAARTYALFRYLTPKYINTPNGQPFFTVRATQADQVYRGYQREQRAPNTSLAAEQTKGIVATYKNNPILAYYFAQSDGKTRSSYQANMTKHPVDYLQSKIDPQGKGKTLKGHGVGLAQMGGITAANQGANFSQILKYYYTGIDLTKMY